MIEARDAIGFLIATSGDAKLAAVRASAAQNRAINEAEILSAIASDPTALGTLNQSVKLLATLQALDAFRMLHIAFVASIPDLAPKDTARTYTQLLQGMGSLSNGTPLQMTDPFKAVMAALPPQVAESVEFFLKNPDAAKQLPESPFTSSPTTAPTSDLQPAPAPSDQQAPPNPPVSSEPPDEILMVGDDNAEEALAAGMQAFQFR